jgi:hypothetical protein
MIFKRIQNFFNMGIHHMTLRFSFSLVFILSCFGVQVASAMDLGKGGCVPPLDHAVRSNIQAQKTESYSCIPSSAKCNGDCCSSVSRLSVMVAELELSPKQKERQEKIEKVKRALEDLIKIEGKSKAAKITEQLIEASSDSDTQSPANSPASDEEGL